MRYCFLVALVAVLALAGPVGAQTYLELGSAPVRDDIPDDGSDWHELYPAFCTTHIQASYEDNGDDIVSVCDYINMEDGTRYHIDWVGPTYLLVDIETTDRIFCEPTEEPGANPIGETWHEVAPVFCNEWEVYDWEDGDLSGDLSECDLIQFGGPEDPWFHVEEIRLDITVTEVPSPAEMSTWSRIKAFLGDLF